MKKIWKTVLFLELYEVSNYGEVRNRKTNYVLKGQRTKTSRYVYLSGYGAIGVHYLISSHFNKHEIHQDSAINLIEDSNKPKHLLPSTRRERTSHLRKKSWEKKNKGKKYVGVYKYTQGNQSWRAALKVSNKYITVGYYKTRKEAHTAYQQKHMKVYGYIND